jgi:glycosyltransferase involved in cell wall biosynthesis
MTTHDATVLITTYNRKEDLRAAIESSLAQEGCRVEVMVIDDCSPDGTGAMVAQEYPEVTLRVAEKNNGYIVHRNLGAELAAAPVVVSIDDDAVFPSKHTVAQTLEDIEPEEVGAVAIPYVDVKIDPAVRQAAPDRDGVWIAEQFRGTAHALKRDLFNRLGGYRTVLRHQAEEGDYCHRMINAGFGVRRGRADPIHHLESPKRSWDKVRRQAARNAVILSWCNVPMPQLGVHLPAVIANMLLDGIKQPDRLGSRVSGIFEGLGTIASGSATRAPIHPAAYRLARRLRTGGPVRMAEVADELAALRAAHG